MDRQLVGEPEGDGEAVLSVLDGSTHPPAQAKERSLILHLSAAKGEVDRQLVGETEGDGEADRDLIDGFANPLSPPPAGGG